MATVDRIAKEPPQVAGPPRTEIGVLGWLKHNLFSTWYDILLTVGSFLFLYVVLRAIITWVLTEARWGVVTTNLKVFMSGRYPLGETWRIWLCLGILAVLAVLTWVSGKFEVTKARRGVTIGWLLSFPVIFILLRGFSEESPVLPYVSMELWSGLLLTFVLALVGIVASFPLGVLLALGRQSTLPVVKALCVIYIELIRGVPLISVLFMAQIMLPLFLPQGLRIGTVIRALIGMTLFSAAYSAENVRGGLAAIPKGQYEAARAIGLNDAQTMVLVILPQALRAVIPAIVGQFISLFKDTSLVVIVGLLDLLGVAKAVTGQREWIGLQKEVYFFSAVIYFIFCYAMSYASRRLEVALGVGER
jgi:general L-amino acid transport system permease protein